MNLQFALDSYHDAGPVSEVETASRYRLIQILMEHGLTQLTLAAAIIDPAHAVKRREALGKAIDAIETLRQSLSSDYESEPLTQRLDALYSHMTEELVRSNLDSNPARISHVQSLLLTIKSAWDQLPSEKPANNPQVEACFL